MARRVLVPLLLIAAIAACAIGVDAFRLGLYSDDWLFLDAARRAPLLDELLGRQGVFPWYRPLAREAYFLAIVAAGPFGLVVARVLALAAVVASAYALYRLAPRAFGGRGGAVAAALFLTFAQTKALAAWASGFQDLAAVAFTLCALLALDRGRRAWALALAVCAMFSKETGFVVVPLLVAWDALVARRAPSRRWLAALGGTTVAAVAVHLLVRTTWTVERVGQNGADIAAPAATPFPWSRLMEFFGGFWSGGLPPGGIAAAVGLAAGAAVVLLVQREPKAAHESRSALGSSSRGFAFAGLALALGLAPALLAQAMGFATFQPWHAYPALAGACLLLAGALGSWPRAAQAAAIAVVVVANAWGESYVAPRDEELRASAPPAHGWWLEVRDEARTRRLERDVRRLLADRPESLVVLYERLPYFSYLQTADGPATREMLGDPTLRTYYLGDAPRGLVPGRVRLLVGSTRTISLEAPGADELRELAITNLLRGDARPARALFAILRAKGHVDAGHAYLDALAAGIDEGPAAYVEALAAADLGDSTATGAEKAALLVGGVGDAGVGEAYRGAFARPTSARAHSAVAESLLARGADLPCAIEWRLATALEPSWTDPRRRLDSLFVVHAATAK